MIKIAMVVPFESMQELALQVFDEHTQFEQKTSQNNLHFEFSTIRASTTEEVRSLNLDADVVIARGAIASDLRRCSYWIPVVELAISGEDLLSILYQLKQQYGAVPAAIIGSDNMILGIEDLARQVGVDVTPYRLTQSTEEEIYRNVEQAISDGKKVILGGMRGCIHAENFGAGHVLLSSGRNSIWNAITAAKQIGLASRRAQEQVLTRSAMVDNAFEGLIALDQDGNISALNQSAREMLGITPGDWCIGMPLREALRAPQIARLVGLPDPYVDEIIEYHNTHLSFKKITIYLRGEVVGCVLTFLNANQIQETEGKLRGKLYHKSHTAKYSFASIIGESPVLREAIRRADAYAHASSNVIIYGESGTGKELFSQSIHNASARVGQPFVAVNCAAIPENLLESELFGYVGGAFTGANKEGKAGLFEIAHNGTIFLDEISEMPLALQGRLLRVIQEREIMRIGHDKVIPIDVRIITATNKDLREQVRRGLFREDLYYRIDVLGLSIPPLRERGGDVRLLARAFLSEFCSAEGRPPLTLTPDAEELLERRSWPGNIRELRNFCERIVVLCREETTLGAAALEQLLSYSAAFHPASASQRASEPAPAAPDAAAIWQALDAAGGNKTHAAELLGISRVTLWRLLKRLSE